MASKEALLEKLKTGVVKYREKDVFDDGHDALEMIIDGLAAGMKTDKEFG